MIISDMVYIATVVVVTNPAPLARNERIYVSSVIIVIAWNASTVVLAPIIVHYRVV